METASRGGSTTHLFYDLAGRKTSMEDPDMGTWHYAYNAVGSLTFQTDARGCTTTLSYDLLNRLTGKTYGGTCSGTPGVTFVYDQGTNGKGQRTYMSDASGNTTWAYDNRGRMLSETKVVNGTGGGTFKTQWTYNSADQVTSMSYPSDSLGNVGEAVTFTYLRQMTLNSVVGANTYVQSTTYDPAGQVNVRTLGANVLKTDYDYFPWTTQGGRLQFIKTGNPTNPISLQRLEYAYDPAGNVDWIKDWKAGNPQLQDFGTYDDLNRLTSATATQGTNGDGNYGTENYVYDNTTGNLQSKAGVSYAYNAQVTCTAGSRTLPHAVSAAGANSYGYDCNGNMTRRTLDDVTNTLTYDAENRLTGVSGGAATSYVYDGDGNRVKASDSQGATVYLGNHLELFTPTTSLPGPNPAPGSSGPSFSGQVKNQAGIGVWNATLKLRKRETLPGPNGWLTLTATSTSPMSEAILYVYGSNGNFIRSETGGLLINTQAGWTRLSLAPGSYQGYVRAKIGFTYYYTSVFPFVINSNQVTSKTVKIGSVTQLPSVGPVSPSPFDDGAVVTDHIVATTLTAANGAYLLNYASPSCAGACSLHIDEIVPSGFSAVSASAPSPGIVVSSTELKYSWTTAGWYTGNNFTLSGTPRTWRYYYYAGEQRIAVRRLEITDVLSYLLQDHLGSTSITASANGMSKTGELRYKPWGETRYEYGSTPTTFRYTGQRVESGIGLYYYGARWYDPELSRWIQPDTIIPLESQGVQAWDRFAYVNNNPVRYNDPTGHLIPIPPLPKIHIPVSNGWDLIAAVGCHIVNTFLPAIPVHFESYGPGQGAIVGEKAPRPSAMLPMVAGVQLSPEAAAISRPDLFRGGSSTDPNFGLKTPDKPYPNGRFDIAPDVNGNVGPGSGGLSTLSEPKPNWQNPWKYPSNAPDPEGIRIFQDIPTENPNHWLWEPAWDMPLKQFKQFLKNTFENWVHPE